MTDLDVPPVEWEDVGARKTLPPELQQLIGASTPTLRVAQTVVRKIRELHARDLPEFEQLDRHLRDWERAGEDPRGHDDPRYQDIWNVFFRDRGRTFIVVIGKDRGGSFNVVSVYSADNMSYFVKRWARGTWTLRE